MLVRTDSAISITSAIAVVALDAKIIRKSAPNNVKKNSRRCTAAYAPIANSASMLRSILVNMSQSQKHFFRFPAARAKGTVVIKNLSLQPRSAIPLSFRAYKTRSGFGLLSVVRV